MRVALLSNVTVEVFAGMLAKEHSVWTPPGFGAWYETSLAPPQSLREFAPDAIALLLDFRFAPDSDPVTVPERIAVASQSLAVAFPNASLIVPDLAHYAQDFGETFHDERSWKLASQPFSLKAMRSLKTLFGVKKAIALDFDGTLWKGVVGEDGVGGIAPNAEFQRELKALKERGVLLVALSKNNADDVEPVWRDERMVLRKDDFAAFAIDWNDKPSNLAKIAERLNLGIDSFVFVDDNPAERAAMRAALPQVATPPFPATLDVYFPLREATAEDLARTLQYQAAAKRNELRSGRELDDWLRELKTWCEVHTMREDEIARVAQLSQRTNQFNATTVRRSPDEIRTLADNPGHSIYVAYAGDRFGDEGLIAYVLVRREGDEAEILDWVMSCRAMNRRVEYQIETKVERDLSAKGAKTLHAVWRQTAKNAPVAELFDSFGFARVSDSPDERHYRRALK